MKLLVFSPYYPPHIGGLETHSDHFNKYLSYKGVDITVFAPKLPREAEAQEVLHKNVVVLRFPALEIIPNYPFPKFWKTSFWEVLLKLYRNNYDLIISRTRFFFSSFLALMFARLKKIKHIHIEHGASTSKLNSKFKTFIAYLYDYTLGTLVLRFSNMNIANSKATADFVNKLDKKRSCDVIYRGVEIDKIIKIKPDLNIKNKYPNRLIITYIGRLIDGKGVNDLLQAIKITEDKKILCFIVGDGPQKENLKKFAKQLGISENIIFFGHKTFKGAVGILKTSDIFINPSYSEGLPTAVIEAALCKKAIIATNVGGTPEIITSENSGFLIESGNAKLLAKKIKKLSENKSLREDLGNNAFEEVKNKFNWNSTTNKYLDKFNEMLD